LPGGVCHRPQRVTSQVRRQQQQTRHATPLPLVVRPGAAANAAAAAAGAAV